MSFTTCPHLPRRSFARCIVYHTSVRARAGSDCATRNHLIDSTTRTRIYRRRRVCWAPGSKEPRGRRSLGHEAHEYSSSFPSSEILVELAVLISICRLQSLGSLPARLKALAQSTQVAMSMLPSLLVDVNELSDDGVKVSRNSASSPKPAASVEQFSFDHDDAVTLHVGPAEHVLLAHSSFIIRNSDLFTTALKKEWAEGQTRVIKLPEQRPQVGCLSLPQTTPTPKFSQAIWRAQSPLTPSLSG